MGLRLVRRRPAPLAWAAGAWAVPAGAARPVRRRGDSRARRGVAGAPQLVVAHAARGRLEVCLLNRAWWPSRSNAATASRPAAGSRRWSLGTDVPQSRDYSDHT